MGAAHCSQVSVSLRYNGEMNQQPTRTPGNGLMRVVSCGSEYPVEASHVSVNRASVNRRLCLSKKVSHDSYLAFIDRPFFPLELFVPGRNAGRAAKRFDCDGRRYERGLLGRVWLQVG